MSEIINKILKKKLKQRKNNEKMKLVEKLRTFDETRAEQCEECGKILVFGKYKNEISQEEKIKLTYGNFCKIKWCVACASKRAMKAARENLLIIQQIEANKKMAYIFLTLTIKNPPLQDLRETLKHMQKSFFKLTNYKDFKSAVRGYFKSVEYLGDNTKKGEAHPHFHCILVVERYYFTSKDYIKHEQWQEMWKKALKIDYMPEVNIQKIRINEKDYMQTKRGKEGKNTQSLAKALFEVSKYSVAPLAVKKINAKEFQILDNQTKRMRQYCRGGLFKQYKPSKEIEIDPKQWELIEEYFYKYCKEKGKYNLKKQDKSGTIAIREFLADKEQKWKKTKLK